LKKLCGGLILDAKSLVIKRGEIWITSFRTPHGHTGRCVVVITSSLLGDMPGRIIVPLSDWKSKYEHVPWKVKICPANWNNLVKTAAADACLVSSLSATRFNAKIGFVSAEELEHIIKAVRMVIELDY
jgi:mRNA interferase MazF